MNVTGAPLAELDQLGEDIAAATNRQIRATLKAITRDWGPHPSVDDLASIRAAWDARVDATLMPHLADAYWRSVNAVSAPIIEHLAARKTQAAAATPGPAGGPPDPEANLADPGLPAAAARAGIRIARVSNPAAAQYMADARNRLVAIADTVWEHARTELVAGMQAGEGVAKLAVRVASVAADLAQPRAEVIARTEVNGAANAGAIGQVRALDVPARKTWLATEDERTRPDHSAADGQEVGVDETFEVGGESMDRPHDESASAEQTINCRCTMTFSIPEDDVSDLAEESETASAVTAAADAAMTGAMIALVPDQASVDRLVIDGQEGADDLHLTLFYLGEAADYEAAARGAVTANVASLFAGFGQLDAVAFGVDYWNPNGEQPAWVLAVGDVEVGSLDEAHETAEQAIGAAGSQPLMPDQHTPWVPHICLAYSTDLDLLPEMIKRVGPVSFDRVRVAFAGDVFDVPLEGAPTS
jgi:2'-5' RNA ligase